MMRGFLKTIHEEFLGEGQLFGSGRFTEFGISLTGWFMGLEMLLVPRSVCNSHVLSILTTFVPVWVIGAPWLVGGTLGLTGLCAFWRNACINSDASRWLRFSSSGVNLVLWCYVTLLSVIWYKGEFPMAFVFAWFAFACYRSSVISFRRT